MCGLECQVEIERLRGSGENMLTDKLTPNKFKKTISGYGL